MSQLIQNNRLCAVCKGNDKELLFQQRFAVISESSLLAGYDIVVCNSCGFCFADNLPDQAAFDVYYREMSKYEHQDRSGHPSEFEMRQFPALAQFIKIHISDTNARILEIGCANGGLLNALKQLGYQNVLGIDPSPVCARNADQLYQIQVLTSALPYVNVDELGLFDFIILVAVLEHIKDLDDTLKIIFDLLSPTGRLYIEVPDATKFCSSPDAPFQEFSVEHINFFSSTSLANLMEMHGFSEVFSSRTSYNQTDTHTGYAIRMVFQKESANVKTAPTINLDAKIGLKDYIEASQKVENRIHQTINELVDTQRPLIVWGVGTHTQRLLATSRLKDAKIIAFVDSNSNYQGKQLNGVPIVNPERLMEMDDSILVSSRIFQSEIVNQIRFVLKLENKIFTLYED